MIAALGVLMVSGSLSIAFSMQHGNHHSCPISFMEGSMCTAFADVFALVRHHIAGFQGFTRAVVNFEIILLITLIGFVFVLFGTFLFKRHKFLDTFNSPGERITALFVAVPFSGFLRWFARLAKRDPERLFRVYGTRKEYIFPLFSFF